MLEARVQEQGTGDQAMLVIDDVAREVGMTVRNLREWRALGLLPPPQIRGRVGYYDRAVVDRVRDIQRLHAEGFTLELIRRMFDAGSDVGREAMRLAELLRAPFRDDEAPAVEPLDLAARWGATEASDLERAVELGLMRADDDGRLRFTSARVARVGEAMWRMGLTLEQTLAATAVVRDHLDSIAAHFEAVWLEHVWEPFVAAGMPEERHAEIEATLAEVPERALDAVVGLFTVAMTERIDAGIAREVSRRAGRPRPG